MRKWKQPHTHTHTPIRREKMKKILWIYSQHWKWSMFYKGKGALFIKDTFQKNIMEKVFFNSYLRGPWENFFNRLLLLVVAPLIFNLWIHFENQAERKEMVNIMRPFLWNGRRALTYTYRTHKWHIIKGFINRIETVAKKERCREGFNPPHLNFK